MGINVKDIAFSYTKNKPLFEHLNLQIENKPQIITIIGETGSGKSTLVEMLNAILIPNKGEIEVFNHFIRPKKNKNLKNVRKDVGLVFQFSEYQLFEETVLKDVMFGPSNYKDLKSNALDSALNALKLLQVDEALYERSPFNLSGGQMRKIAIAGILALNPQVLILDEPTVGLDAKAKVELIKILVDLKQNQQKTIIIITHDMDLVAKIADRAIVLKHGEITFDGTPQNLFNQKALLKVSGLDLPLIGKIAEALKKDALIDYSSIPLTLDELLKVIR